MQTTQQNITVSPINLGDVIAQHLAYVTDQYQKLRQYTEAKIQEIENKQQKHDQTLEEFAHSKREHSKHLKEIADVLSHIVHEQDLFASTRGNRDIVLHCLKTNAHGPALKDAHQRFFDHLNKQIQYTHTHTHTHGQTTRLPAGPRDWDARDENRRRKTQSDIRRPLHGPRARGTDVWGWLARTIAHLRLFSEGVPTTSSGRPLPCVC